MCVCVCFLEYTLVTLVCRQSWFRVALYHVSCWALCKKPFASVQPLSHLSARVHTQRTTKLILGRNTWRLAPTLQLKPTPSEIKLSNVLLLGALCFIEFLKGTYCAIIYLFIIFLWYAVTTFYSHVKHVVVNVRVLCISSVFQMGHIYVAAWVKMSLTS